MSWPHIHSLRPRCQDGQDRPTPSHGRGRRLRCFEDTSRHEKPNQRKRRVSPVQDAPGSQLFFSSFALFLGNDAGELDRSLKRQNSCSLPLTMQVFSVFAINRFCVEIHYSSRFSHGNMKWPLNERFLENLFSSFQY